MSLWIAYRIGLGSVGLLDWIQCVSLGIQLWIDAVGLGSVGLLDWIQCIDFIVGLCDWIGSGFIID